MTEEISLEQAFKSFGPQKKAEKKAEKKEVPLETALAGFPKTQHEPTKMEATKAFWSNIASDPAGWWKDNAWTWGFAKTINDYDVYQKQHFLELTLRDRIEEGKATEEEKKLYQDFQSEHGMERFVKGHGEIKKFAQEKKKGPWIKQVGKEGESIVESAFDNPLLTGSAIAAGLVADLPLLLMTWGAALPETMAGIVRSIGAAEKAAAVTKVVAGATEGFGVGYGGEAAKEYQETGKVDSAKAAASGLSIAVLDVASRAIGAARALRGKKGEFTAPEESPRPATDNELQEARSVFQDEREWGLFNDTQANYEALRGHWDPVHETIQAATRATEDLGQNFQSVPAGKPRIKPKKKGPELISNEEIAPLLVKDRSKMTAEEQEKLNKWWLQGGLAGAGGLALAYAMADEQGKKEITEAALLTGFFLKSPRVVAELKRGKGTAGEWIAEINALAKKNRGMSEELKWHDGFRLLMRDPEHEYTKDEVVSLLKHSPFLHMDEVVLGGPSSSDIGRLYTHYSQRLKRKYGEEWEKKATPEERKNFELLFNTQAAEPAIYGKMEGWNTPGTTDHRELLIQMPRAILHSPEAVEHFGQHGENLAMHMRGATLVSTEGKRFFHLDEIQSDTAARLRKVEGRLSSVLEEKKLAEKDFDTFRAGEEKRGSSWRKLSQKEVVEKLDKEIAKITKERDRWAKLLKESPFVGKTEDWTSLGLRRLLRYAMDRGFDGVTLVSPEVMVGRTGKGWPRKYYGEVVPKSFEDIVKTLGGKTEKIRFDTRGTDRGAQEFVGVRFTPEMKAKINEGFSLFDRQGGKAQTELLALLAAGGIGGAIGFGWNNENSIEKGLWGIAAGILAVKGGKFAIAEAGPKVAKGVTSWYNQNLDRVRIKDLVDSFQHLIEGTSRSVMQASNTLHEKVPNIERRRELTAAMDGKKTQLSKDEGDAVNAIGRVFVDLHRAASQIGVLDSVRLAYLKANFDRPGVDRVKLQKFLDSVQRGETPFSFVKEGKAAGLSPISEDISWILAKYSNVLSHTVARKKLLNALKNDSWESGPLVIPESASRNIPPHYVRLDGVSPMMEHMRVHPDIAPELKFIFDANNPDSWLKALSMVSTASKRAKISLSGFHGMALSQAFIASEASLKVGVAGALIGGGVAAATGSDVRRGMEYGLAAGLTLPALKIPAFALGTSRLLKQLREGGAGDEVDKALRDGLKISFQRQLPVVGEAAQDMYSGLEYLQAMADKFLPPASIPLRKYEQLNHAIDNFMWGRLHAGMKLYVYSVKKSKLLKDNARAHEKIPSIPLMAEQEAGEIAARYANSIFGGINWLKMVEGVKNKAARDFASALTKPSGMRKLNLLEFAPDWTYATTQSALKALDWRPGERELAALHLNYMLRAALWTYALGDALNYTFTGKRLDQNKDKTVVELGDGYVMQLSKHFNESFHWGMEPGKQAMSKLGFVPQVAIEGAEVLKGEEKPGKFGKDLVKQFIPFSAQSEMSGKGWKEGISSAIGLPVRKRSGKEWEKVWRPKKKKSSDERLDEALDKEEDEEED